MSRRALFTQTASIAAGAVACEATPPSEFIFPEGQTIDQAFIENQENLQKIIATAQRFPSATIIYPGRTPEVKFRDTSGLLPVVAATKATALSLRENRRSTLTVRLQFEEEVYAKSQQPFNDPTFVSAFLITIGEKNPPVNPSRPSVINFEGRQFATPIRYIQMNFRTSYTSLYGKDTIIVLNRGILQHQPDRAIFLPVRLRLVPLDKTV